jgi:hypothetical protein
LQFPFHTKIVGVSYDNDDGTSRQSIIRHRCRPGLVLKVRREPRNKYGKNAIALWVPASLFHGSAQIGYISHDLAEELAPYIDRGGHVVVTISDVTGGGRDKYYGVNVLIASDRAETTQELTGRSPGIIYWIAVATKSLAVWSWRGVVLICRRLPSAAEAARRGAVLSWHDLVDVYRGLPDWAVPVVWGVGAALPVALIMAIARAFMR